MKLKKIASLALAGIMAVSMLAGCKDGTNQEEPSSSSQVPAATGVVAYANECLSSKQKEVFTFKSSADLDKMLTDVANDRGTLSSAAIEGIYKVTNGIYWSGNQNAGVTDVKKALDGKMTNAYLATNFGTAPSSNVTTQKMVNVFAVSGALVEEDAIKAIVDSYKVHITGTNFPATIKTGEFSCDYEAEISAVKVSSAENPSKTAWVVAIVLTQNLTKTANA